MSGASAGERKYLVPIKVLSEAKRLGVTLTDLHEMLKKSARITHEKGNRRYHDVVFSVTGDRVDGLYRMTTDEVSAEEQMLSSYVRSSEMPTSEQRNPTTHTTTPTLFYRCETCRDTGQMRVFDECEVCHGRGCRHCDEGLVPSSVNCPDCREKDHVGVYQKQYSQQPYSQNPFRKKRY
jgi:hypothetical protein